jgi:hypothetical protein
MPTLWQKAGGSIPCADIAGRRGIPRGQRPRARAQAPCAGTGRPQVRPGQQLPWAGLCLQFQYLRHIYLLDPNSSCQKHLHQEHESCQTCLPRIVSRLAETPRQCGKGLLITPMQPLNSSGFRAFGRALRFGRFARSRSGRWWVSKNCLESSADTISER